MNCKIFYLLDEDDDDIATLIDPTLIEEDFLSDDDSVDFDTMMELPPNVQNDGTEENISHHHAGIH